MKKFIKGISYHLKYTRTLPSRRWKGSNRVSEYQQTEYNGFYEYIGSRGGKLHFYNNQAGVDLLATKAEALSYLVK